jgi:hypothetical protein
VVITADEGVRPLHRYFSVTSRSTNSE